VALVPGGDLARAESGFAAVLKRSPQFYPSDTAMGYLDLARKDFESAGQRFDRVLQSNASYVPALVGRGEALLALSREAEALASFESAVKLDPQLQGIARRVEVLRARAQQDNVANARKAGAGKPPGRSGALVRTGDCRVSGQRVSRARSRRGRGETGEDRRGARAVPARHRNGPDGCDVEDADRRDARRARRPCRRAQDVYEANSLEPTAELRRRITAIEARLAYLKLPPDYRAIPDTASITRGDLASLIGIRLAALIEHAPGTARSSSPMRAITGRPTGSWRPQAPA
jgi:tetratricopeptide (TPR) repeat protein